MKFRIKLLFSNFTQFNFDTEYVFISISFFLHICYSEAEAISLKQQFSQVHPFGKTNILQFDLKTKQFGKGEIFSIELVSGDIPTYCK